MDNQPQMNHGDAVKIIAGIIRRIIQKGLDKAPQASFTMDAPKEVSDEIGKATQNSD